MVPPAALIGFSGWASIEVCRRRRILPASATFVQTSSESGHERRFRDVRDESDLPPTPERLRHRSEPTLRTRIGYSRPGYRVVLTRHQSKKPRSEPPNFPQPTKHLAVRFARFRNRATTAARLARRDTRLSGILSCLERQFLAVHHSIEQGVIYVFAAGTVRCHA